MVFWSKKLTYTASSHTRTRSQPSGGSRWKEHVLLGRGEEEQGCNRGGSSANEGSDVDGEGHTFSQSTGSAWKDRNIKTFINNTLNKCRQKIIHSYLFNNSAYSLKAHHKKCCLTWLSHGTGRLRWRQKRWIQRTRGI